jgi:hypothetical protein
LVAVLTTILSPKYIPDHMDIGGEMCCFDVDSPAPEEKRVLSKLANTNSDYGTGTEMNIVLLYRQRNSMMTRCTWHGTKMAQKENIMK